MSFPPPPPPPPGNNASRYPPPGQTGNAGPPPPPPPSQQRDASALQNGMHNLHVSQQQQYPQSGGYPPPHHHQQQQQHQFQQQSAPSSAPSNGFQAPPAPPMGQQQQQQQQFQPPPHAPSSYQYAAPPPPGPPRAPQMQQQAPVRGPPAPPAPQEQQQQQFRPPVAPYSAPPAYQAQQQNQAPTYAPPPPQQQQQMPPPAPYQQHQQPMPPPMPNRSPPPPPSPYTGGQGYPPGPPPPPGPPGTGYSAGMPPPPAYSTGQVPPPNAYAGGSGYGAGMPPLPPGPPGSAPGMPPQQQQYQQQQAKIDPSQIPRPPLFTRPNDDGPLPIYSTKAAAAQTRIAPPPPADSRYLVHDDGNASPQLIRSSLYTIPRDRGTWQKLGEMDMGLLCSPMALPSQDYVPTMGPQADDGWKQASDTATVSTSKQAPLDPQRIPLILGNNNTNTSAPGNGGKALLSPPPRCRSCQAYINPYYNMETNTCNFCGTRNLHTDFDPMCLQKGTVDFAVDGPYITRTSPVQPIFLYALDLTCAHVEDYVDMLEQVGVDLALHFQRQPGHQALQQKWEQQEMSSSNINSGSEANQIVPLLQQQRPRIGICFVASCGIFVLSGNGPGGMLQALVMSDVTDDPFCHVPLQDWTFDLSTPEAVDEWTQHVQEHLLEGELIKTLRKEAGKKNSQGLDGYELSCGGAAMAFCADALAESGGRATWISSRRPNFGAGYIRPRGSSAKAKSQTPVEDATPLQLLQKPANKQDETAGEFYRKLQEKCTKNRIVLDIIIHSNPDHVSHQSLDLATQGEICRATCGKITWISSPGLGWKEPLIEELRRPLLCFQGWDSVFKVRCSAGIQVKTFLSHPGTAMDAGGLGSPELEMSCATPQTNVSVLLEHKIGGIPKNDPFVFVQSALLYSTLTGQRRVRVSTIALRPSTSLPDIFLSIDFAAFTTLCLRRAVANLKELSTAKAAAKEDPQKAAKAVIIENLVKVLVSYRQHTNAINSPRGQLILPEKLQLLPLFGMCLLKSPMLRPSLGRRVGPAVVMSPTNDERAHYTFQATMVGPASAFLLVHPNLFSIDKPLADGVGDYRVPRGIETASSELSQASYHSTVQLPPTVNASMTSLSDNGVYLIDTGLVIYLFIGREVAPEFRQELYHLPISLSSSATTQTVTEESQRIRRIVWQLRSFCSVESSGSRSEVRPSFPPVIPVCQGDSQHLMFEQELMNWMVDDPSNGEKDYTDFLCKLHRLIREKVEPTGKK